MLNKGNELFEKKEFKHASWFYNYVFNIDQNIECDWLNKGN